MATPIPRNAARFTLAEILAVTGGAVIAAAALAPDAEIVSISTDTRALVPGAAFVALHGEVHDGHAHVDAAARAGASVAIVEREIAAPSGLAVVRVKSTLSALGDLARAHARRWRALGGGRKLVAITGSAGKTTTRVAVAALLERLRPGGVHGGQGNLNNRVGVPMVLLGLGPEHTIGVIEMGMNRPDEIAELCRIAEPEVGVVTLVAAAHTELVGSIDGVAHEKHALFRALPEGGVALGNGDDPRVRLGILSTPARRRILYGRSPDAQVKIVARELRGLDRSQIRLDAGDDRVLDFVTPLLGEAGALASAAAFAVVDRALGLPLTGEACAEAFARADVGAGAGRLVPRLFASGLAVIDDSYNANPASMISSIRAAAELAASTSRRLVLVLGEMRELGVESAPGHDEVGRAAAASGAVNVFAIAGDAARIAARAAEAGVTASFTDRVDDAAALLLMAVRPQDLVLVKGSRSIGTERLIGALAEAHGGIAGGRLVIYELFYPLKSHYSWLSWLNVLRYIPFRTIMATITAMLLTFVLAPWFIRELRRKQIGQVVRSEGPETHKVKAGTPTMGGALILLSLLLPTALWADLRNPFVLATTAVTAGYGVIGYLDDYLKIKRKNTGGLPGRYKLLGQTLIGGSALCYTYLFTSKLPADWIEIKTRLALPFAAFSKHSIDLPLWFYIPFALFVVVSWSNAVNLTDGLDGLAIGPVMINAGTYLIWSYVAGATIANFSLANYLDIPKIASAGELAVYCGSVIGAGIGFLWYNTYPAQVFMGDVGSLALGGGLGMLAIFTKNELLSILLGGVFFVETISVIAQVTSFKLTGKRVFLMAPIHHHYEKKGWAEPKIIVRFWIISILLALVSLSSMKLR